MDLLKSKRLEIMALFAVAAFVGAALHWVRPAAAAQTKKQASTASDIEIDRACGLLERPWSFNLVRLNAPLISPRQMSVGYPPYDQQPEKALSVATPLVCLPSSASCH